MLVAASFGEVFRDNCITQRHPAGRRRRPRPLGPLRPRAARRSPGPVRLRVDLQAQRLEGPGFAMDFDLPAADRTALLDGLDEVGMTLLQADAIAAWEGAARPWLQRLRPPGGTPR